MMTRIVWAVVVAVVALAAAIVWRAERVLGRPDTEFRYVVVIPAKASLTELERTWRARAGGADVRVRRDGDGLAAEEIEVVIRGAPRGHATALTSALGQPGTLEFRWVVDDTDTARAWFRAFGSADNPRTDAPDVVGYVDMWNVDARAEERTDYFLAGPDRDTIVARLAEYAPDDLVPPNLELMVEALPQSGVRTYLVEREPFIRASDVVAAAVEKDPVSERSMVTVTLSPAAAARFATATAANIGDKCAMIVDGVIIAAPIVQGAIRGGRVSIVSTDRPAAEALAAALHGGVLPPGIHARLIAATGHDHPVWTVRLVVAIGGLVIAFVLGPWVRRRLPLAPLGVDAAPRPRRRWWPLISALLVTSAVLVALWYVRWTLLPGFSDEFAGAMIVDRTHTAIASVHILTLGLAPYLAAVLGLELVAMIRPRWRARRLGSAAERRPIDGAIVVLTVILAIVQAVLLLRFFDSLGGEAGEEVLAEGPLPRAMMVGALLGGVALTLGGAALISRHGLGNGTLVIAAALALDRQVSPPLWVPAAGRMDALAAFALVAVAAGFVARLRPHGTRLPWAGLAPALVIGTALASLVAFVDSAAAAAWLWQLDRRVSGWPTAVVVAVVTRLALWPRRASALGIDGAISIAAVLALTAVLHGTPSLPWALSLASAVVVGAAVVELYASASRCARLVRPTAVLVVHDVARADRFAELLARAGVPYAVTGIHARALLRFLAAYCPITVSVAAADVEAAMAALAGATAGAQT